MFIYVVFPVKRVMDLHRQSWRVRFHNRVFRAFLRRNFGYRNPTKPSKTQKNPENPSKTQQKTQENPAHPTQPDVIAINFR